LPRRPHAPPFRHIIENKGETANSNEQPRRKPFLICAYLKYIQALME